MPRVNVASTAVTRILLAALMALAAVVFAWGLAGCATEIQQSADSQHAITQARFLLSDDDTPPADSSRWEAVSLPDNWSVSRRNQQGIGWYRMSFDVGPGEPGRVAILLRRLSMNGEFFVNGSRVLSGGRMSEPVTRNWNTPFYFEVPSVLLRPGANTLDVRLFAYRNNNGGLGRVVWGKPEVLQAEQTTLYALHIKGAVMSFSVAVIAAFIGIATWVRMKRSAAYGLFGLAMIAWAARYLNYFVHDVPIEPTLYSVIVNSAQGWFFIFFTPFLLRLSRIHWPRFEAALYAAGLLGTAAIYLAFRGEMAIALVIAVWSCVWVPGALILLTLSAVNAWRTRTAQAMLSALVAWLYVPLTFREMLITSGVMPFDESYISHYVGMPLALLISWLLVDRLVAHGQKAARAELAQAQAAFDERLRITQDMHDGLGLQLNAALRVVERGGSDRDKVVQSLRACLDELRIIVDSSATAASEFLPLLASLRQRLQRRLEIIGIEIRWTMDAFPSGLVLPPATTLQVLRIVQEAINNTIKHAHASEIEFRVADDAPAGCIAIEVRDNGVGIAAVPENTSHTGRGLSGMQRRAMSAGIELSIHSAPGGTTIRIELPDPRMPQAGASVVELPRKAA